VDVGGVEVHVFGRLPGAAKASMPDVPPLRYVGVRQSSSLGTAESQLPEIRDALAALALDPTTDRYLAVAYAYSSAGISDRAYDYLRAGLERDRTSAALHDALARTWRDWGFPDRALVAAHAAVYHAPTSAAMRNTLGTVLWALGNRAAAETAFEEATDLDRHAWFAWKNRCHAAFVRGATKDATAYCRTATQLRRTVAQAASR
jgi:Flp pilus assembly protein TadD